MLRDYKKKKGLLNSQINLCVVLQRREGLVVVWVLLLRAVRMYSCLLHADDLRDAELQERKSENCTQ